MKHINNSYNITVYDNDNLMLQHGIEFLDNETDELIEVRNWSYISEWLDLSEAFTPKNEHCIIYNVGAIFDGRAVYGRDYAIVRLS